MPPLVVVSVILCGPCTGRGLGYSPNCNLKLTEDHFKVRAAPGILDRVSPRNRASILPYAHFLWMVGLLLNGNDELLDKSLDNS